MLTHVHVCILSLHVHVWLQHVHSCGPNLSAIYMYTYIPHVRIHGLHGVRRSVIDHNHREGILQRDLSRGLWCATITR